MCGLVHKNKCPQRNTLWAWFPSKHIWKTKQELQLLPNPSVWALALCLGQSELKTGVPKCARLGRRGGRDHSKNIVIIIIITIITYLVTNFLPSTSKKFLDLFSMFFKIKCHRHCWKKKRKKTPSSKTRRQMSDVRRQMHTWRHL